MGQKLTDIAPTGQYTALHLNAAQATATRVPLITRSVVSTTATTAIAGGGASTTVTPVAMTNITAGRPLLITGGTGTAEEVIVQSVTATTFTANFANAHSGTYTISERNSGHWLGTIVVGDAGTAMVLTLYNGNPAVTYSASSTSPAGGVIAALKVAAGVTYTFNLDVDYDLWYTYTGTTAGDVTICYRPKP